MRDFKDLKIAVAGTGHEWMRAKWSAPIRKYWKISEQMMVKYCDLAADLFTFCHSCGIK